MTTEYPEHERLRAISDQSQVCGEFIEWLEGHGYHVCQGSNDESFWPTHTSVQDLLAAFFGIDRKKIDAEKEAMLDAIRAVNGGGNADS